MRNEVDTLRLKKRIRETKPTSRNPVYNSHLYWSQKSYNIIDLIIEELSDPGDIIFDPFMGSGVTILESVKKNLGRSAIGVDVNEMPTFIVKTLLGDLRKKNYADDLVNFSLFLDKLSAFYNTQLPNGETATITKVLFDKPNRTENSFFIKKIFYKYNNEKGEKTGKDIYESDYQLMKFYSENLVVENIKLLPNSRIAVGQNDHIADIFTPRNFSVLNKIVEYIEKNNNNNVLRYLLMSVLHLSKITDTHSNSQWPLWIPKKNAIEKNIVELLKQRITRIEKTTSFLNSEYSDNLNLTSNEKNIKIMDSQFAKVLLKGSQNINNQDVPDNSIDLVITDPPYMDQVLYSEYMQLYQPFLKFQYNLEDEIVVSNGAERNKGKSTYFDLLDKVFRITSDKAKEDSYMALYFHDSSLTVWEELLSVLESNGFKYITQQHIPKVRTLKNILSPKKSLSGDAILLFQNTKNKIESYNQIVSSQEMVEGINEQAQLIIEKAGRPLGTPELYDMGVMEFIIQNGWLPNLSKNFPSLVEIFEQGLTWSPENGVWTI